MCTIVFLFFEKLLNNKIKLISNLIYRCIFLSKTRWTYLFKMTTFIIKNKL